MNESSIDDPVEDQSVTASSQASDIILPEPGSGRVFAAYLLVQVTLFMGLVWKWSYFYASDEVYHRFPLADDFFPAWLQSADVVRNAYLGALGCIIVGVIGLAPWLRSIAAAATTGCLGVLLVHQASYNDMTFATSAWVSLWVLWLTTRMPVDEPFSLMQRAAFLSRVIGSMILLGGAVGKWTPEYWSGEVFYDIYFIDRDFWVFNLLRERYDAETLKVMAAWYSRKVIVVETIAGFGMWLLPPKAAAAVGVTIYFSIAFFSNHLLFSVLWCMVGISAAGFFVTKKQS
ncbi:hypothetical protein LOC67_03785 [Stieleria sp. JC731]|uniref:hypothetical protein n=1 Tax=Pirellulaceae TaxID=2691357 RepID=UPI001E5924AC|nr:hypothetical protein [Stieleria sp. JC731]MCC9599671.1 hypothetical protein [Stieleria sp. JC731]